MSTSFGVIFPLWSFVESADLLDRVVGEIGVDRVSTIAVGGPLRQFRFASGFERPRFATQGGWHYPPDRSRYSHSFVTPKVADWVGKRHTLDQLARFVEARGLRLSLRVSFAEIAALADANPSLARRDAWGEASEGVCLSNPDARELVRETLDDLRSRSPITITLADRLPTRTSVLANSPIAWSPQATELADLCFCPSCRQAVSCRGGAEEIDADSAARSVRVLTPQLVAEASRADRRDPVIDAYRAAVEADFEGWLTRLAEHAETTRLIVVCDEKRSAPAGWSGEHCGNEPVSDSTVDAFLLRAWRPDVMLSADLVRTVNEVVGQGARWVDFSGLDEAPEEAVDWVRQAVRFARRA